VAGIVVGRASPARKSRADENLRESRLAQSATQLMETHNVV